MRRLPFGLLMLLCLSSCATPSLTDMQRTLTTAAEQKLERLLAAQFTRRLGSGIDAVIAGLAHSGGYLDNPLVRVLLPPPVGLALGVVQVLRDAQDPEAALLERLINQAAETAVPGAAPVLQAALTSLTTGDVQTLLGASRHAATEALETRTRSVLRETLEPVIVGTLADSGATELYDKLLAVKALNSEIQSGTVPTEPAPDLGSYVTERTVAGLFKALAEEEGRIRDQLAATAQWRLPAQRALTGSTG